MSIKHEKNTNLMMKYISDIIQFDLKDPNIGFVTITDLKVNTDYSSATVYCSFLGKDERNVAGLKALNRARGHIRSGLGKKMSIRKVPELNFKLDKSLEHGNKIASILVDIHRDNKE